MLKKPIDQKTLTKQKIKMFTVIAIFGALLYGVQSFFGPHKPPPSSRAIFVSKNAHDTTEIDITGWDQKRVDSLINSGLPKSTPEDDSLYKAYGLDKLDSMMHSPTYHW